MKGANKLIMGNNNDSLQNTALENWKELEESGELINYLIEEFDRPTLTIGDVAVKLCNMSTCDKCPVTLFDCDTRTEEDIHKHKPCQVELLKWIIREAVSYENANKKLSIFDVL